MQRIRLLSTTLYSIREYISKSCGLEHLPSRKPSVLTCFQKVQLGDARSYGTAPNLAAPLAYLAEEGGHSKKQVDEVIKAVLRAGSGKISAKKERNKGLVPSIVYEQRDGHLRGHRQLIAVESKQIYRLLKHFGRSFFLSRTFTLETVKGDGATEEVVRERVIPRSVHLHAGTDELLNVTFMRAVEGAHMKVDIPLVFVGEDACPGIRRGGTLNTIKRTVKFLCPADAIPPSVEVDLSSLNVGDKVLQKDLKVDPRLCLVSDSLLPVCKIRGGRGATE
eukprot:jgi/Mesen1/6934/ME000036S06269